jgi:hypothetical protein
MASMTENLIFARNLQKILSLADFSPHCSKRQNKNGPRIAAGPL